MKTKEIIVTVHRVEPEETFGLKDVLDLLGSVFCVVMIVVSFYFIFYPLG